MPDIDEFIEKLHGSLDDGSFVKLTLSEPCGAEPGLRNLYGRVVELRDGRQLSLVWRYATRDITKNLAFTTAVSEISGLLGGAFERARLFTTQFDWELRCKAGRLAKFLRRRPAFTTVPPTAHNRLKPHAFANDSPPFLQALGVTAPSGEPRPGMADKLRQIRRFTEILGHLLDDSALRDRRELRVMDMGSGKGYLTFATCEFLRQRGVQADVTGVEVRQDLVELTNRVSVETGFASLRFVQGVIGDFPAPSRLDLLIALHACNTATDDAIFQGIKAGASLIITAPCCHQEIRAQMIAPPVLRDVLRHGILCEREAEILTDALRALLLEISGYQASVFEFISPEHTGKNLLIAAHKRPSPPDAAPLRERLRALLQFYGVREQRLARLLGELPIPHGSNSSSP